MKKIFLALGVFLLLTSNGSAQPIGAQPGLTETIWSARDLTSALGASSAYSIIQGTGGVSSISWQTIFSAAPASITINLEGSLDCSNYVTIDSSTSVNGELRVVTGTFKCVRLNNTVVTTGAGKTLTALLTYNYKRAEDGPWKEFSFVLTSEQLLNLHLGEISLIQPKAFDCAPILWSFSAYKPAGTAYTVDAADDISVGQFGQPIWTIETTGFLDQSTEQRRAARSGVGLSYLDTWFNLPINVRLGGQILSGNTPLYITFWYIDGCALTH